MQTACLVITWITAHSPILASYTGGRESSQVVFFSNISIYTHFTFMCFLSSADLPAFLAIVSLSVSSDYFLLLFFVFPPAGTYGVETDVV